MLLVRVRSLVILLVLAGGHFLPFALAHEGDHGEQPDPGDGGFYIPPPDQGSQPDPLQRVRYYSYYQSSWLYGTHAVKVFPGQYVRDLAGDGDWLVWQDALSKDIFAYNLAAGDGFYVTTDSSSQQRPDVSDGVVVWEDKRSGPTDILAYFTETGETRRLSRGGPVGTNHMNPSIDGTWVAWEDDRDEEVGIWAYDIQTNQEVRVSDEDARARNTDPVVIGNTVVYRTYRFNVWDLKWFDLVTGESGTITADRQMEQAPFRAGKHIMFLKESELGWRLQVWDPVSRLTTATDVFLQNPTPPAADGDVIVQVNFDGPRASFVARNLSSGAATRVTGYLPIQDVPALVDRTLHIPVYNGTNAAIVSMRINPYALLKQPTLLIDSPEDGAIVKGGEMRVKGTLSYEATWGEPDYFVYGVNGQNHTAILPGPEWAFRVDFAGARPGLYEISVEAHYKDAPSIVKRITVVNPAAYRGQDIEEAGREFHALRVHALYYRYILSNPAIIALAALAIVLVGLWVTRRRLTRVDVRRSVVEYVRPDDE